MTGLGPAALLLISFTTWIDDIFFPLLTSGWFTPFAILMDLQFYLPQCRLSMLRVFGKAIIVLQIYYCKAWGATDTAANPDAFVLSCIFLFFDEVIVYFGAKYLMEQLTGKKFSEVDNSTMLEHFEKVRENDLLLSSSQKACDYLMNKVWKNEEDTAYNVYMDFRLPMRKVMIVFFAQFGLVMYYIFEMSGGDTDDDAPGLVSHNPKKVSFVKWMFAVATIIVAGDDEVGPPFSTTFWMNQWNKASDNLGEKVEQPSFGEHPWKAVRYYLWGPLPRLVFRTFCDASINGLARSVIRGTAPIMLCVEGPLDFVKDATALFFVIKLDDIDADVDLKKEEKWKDFADPQEAADRIFSCEEADQVRQLLNFPDQEAILSLIYKDAEAE
mmetsp:Transcript_62748/g.173940  ORF Transcript_62748/g.173940 Transcript_62748/m.173940 type:complete len:384 (+) Transcript_62748:99-1250(+)